MAENNLIPILFRTGSQSEYDTLKKPEDNTIYFIIDKKRIYKGSDLVAAVNEVTEFLTSTPEPQDMVEGKLYVVTENDESCIYVKSGSGIIKVNGGMATEYEPGSITFEAFNSEVYSDNIVGGDGSNRRFPTEQAVKDYVDQIKQDLEGASEENFVDVSDKRSPDNAGTILTFTKKSGDTVEVTIKDLFLNKAEYDRESRKLKLYVADVTDPVEVDLSDLVPETSVIRVSDKSELLQLTEVSPGQQAFVTSEGKMYVLVSDNPAVETSWKALATEDQISVLVWEPIQ